MPRRRHYPPSRLRYEQTHPTVSVRVTQKLYDQLKALKEQSGKSVTDILREAIGVQAPSVRNAYERGYKKGQADADRRYRVDYRCSKCGGTLTISSDKEKQAAASYMRENGWAHASCLR